MPRSDLQFSTKFFRPSHRTVAVHNCLLDTRTKHTIAQDRLIVAEQRFVAAERRKSASNLQALAFAQKKFEKKFAAFHHVDRHVPMRDRSSSEVVFPHLRSMTSLIDSLPNRLSKLSASLNDDKHNLLALPELPSGARRRSVCSDGDVSDKPFFISDMESDDDEGELSVGKGQLPTMEPARTAATFPRLLQKINRLIPPIVTVFPPDEDLLIHPENDYSHYR